MSTFNPKPIITLQATFNGVQPTKSGKAMQASFVLNTKDRNEEQTTTWLNLLASDDLQSYLSKWKPGTDGLITFTTSLDKYFINIKEKKNDNGLVYQMSGILLGASKLIPYTDKREKDNTSVQNSTTKTMVEGNVDTEIDETEINIGF